MAFRCRSPRYIKSVKIVARTLTCKDSDGKNHKPWKLDSALLHISMVFYCCFQLQIPNLLPKPSEVLILLNKGPLFIQ